MSDIDLNDMMLFIAVIDAGSFTLAAERVNIPKANLSRKIARLESNLGVTLLERTTRTQHITEVGMRYLEHCRRIQQELELAKVSVAKSLDTVSGKLKVGASVGIGHEVLKESLAQFIQLYPNVNLQLELINRRVDLIEEGFDLVIRIGDLDDSRLVAKRLGKISRKLYSSPQYLQSQGDIKSVQQLSECDFLLMNSAQNSTKLTLSADKQHYECKLEPKAIVDDFTLLKQLVIDGLGVAVLPDYMCQEALIKSELVSVLPNWGMETVDIFALYPKHRLDIPKVRAFLEFIQTLFAQRLSV
ncbi:LysR family transcriptional regulator [Pseudoalteromonas sp. NEC-BIFX-2020_015]|uniref:LysR family transcriptional regulator n=1 Tax=Pseudoalteromonas sp. NEC-BIFX-2020_015 TaxID=2729544 RepID=UPI0032C22387